MSLRDDLARSLVSLVIKGMSEQPRPNPSDPTTNGVHIPFGSDPDHFPYMAYFDLAPIADECIRQMEWAAKEMRAESKRVIQSRYDGEHRWVNIPDVLHAHDDLLECPLTLAPEDWTP